MLGFFFYFGQPVNIIKYMKVFNKLNFRKSRKAYNKSACDSCEKMSYEEYKDKCLDNDDDSDIKIETTNSIAKQPKLKNFLGKAYGYLVGILLVGITGVLSSMFTNADSAWFMALNKPAYYPPTILFGIGWTINYIITAFVVGRMINKNAPQSIITLLVVNCVLQILWCLFFFMLQMTGIGMLILVALLIVNIIAVNKIYKIDKVSAIAYLFVILWLVYASMLNYGIIMLN